MLSAIILLILGVVLAAILAVASKVFHVEKDPRMEKIAAILPQANCGACGFAGCGSFAEAVVNGSAKVNACIPGGNDVAAKIGDILGMKAEKTAKKVAIIHCNRDLKEDKIRYNYHGIQDCNAAALLFGGDASCVYACLGMGSCQKACPFGAIDLTERGVPRINEEKCVACGICIDTCPKKIIDYKLYGKDVDVLCASKDKGAVAMKVCSVSCIGCKKCENICPVKAITVIDNCAKIDYSLCVSCGKCAEVCPRKSIEDKLLRSSDAEKRVPPTIIAEKCIGCTICAKNCPVKAIAGEVKKPHVINKETCIACGICVGKCPKDAIEWTLKKKV